MALSQTLTKSQVAPAGLIMAWSSKSPPEGWLLCDGSAISRTIFAALFGVCSTTYGSGDGSTTFNLPNLTSRVAIGKGASNSLAQTGKGVTATASPANTNNISADHSHSGNTGGSSSDHQHSQYKNSNDMAWSSGVTANHYHGFSYGGANTTHYHSMQSHTHTVPDIAINYIIRAY